MVFINTENRPGCINEVKALKKMFHSLCIEVRFVLNPTSRVRMTALHTW